MLKKILVVSATDSLGGAEKILKMISNYYIGKYNVSISIFFLQKRSKSSWDDLLINRNITLVYGKSESIALGLISLIFFVRKFRKFDYIFSSQTVINGFIGLLIKFRLIHTKFFIARESTTIFTRFSGIKLFVYRLSYYMGYRNIDLLICQTKHMKNELKLNLPVISKHIKVKVIPNPINLSTVKNDQIGFNINYDFIVSAGRLIEEKGFEFLIDAFNLLQNDYPNLNLVILGEGPLRKKLELKISDLDLSNRVFLLGHVINVLPYFNAAKACVVSSRIEGFPNVVLEMMSQNTKVITTNCACGIDELEGVCLVEVNDVSSLFNALKNILKSDASQNRALFDRELKSRSVDKYVNKIESFLKK